MFKFRTLTICLNLRVVVTVLWVVSCRVLHPSPVTISLLAFSLRHGSGSFQFPPALLTSFQTIRNMALTWNEKKIHKESTQRTKVALGLFLPCIKKKKSVCYCDPFSSQPLFQDTVTL